TAEAAPAAPAEPAPAVTEAATEPATEPVTESRNKILTVCGNGLGTSLFLKNTLEQVLDRWGWSPYLTVEATDTISARGKAKEADVILTSGEIARALGDVGVPVKVIENFTSTTELDAAMRELYDV
ncbi:PTS sugar transporter subunit IIB, partial [Kocuria oceani]